MANYVLQIDLVGAEKAEGILNSLSGLGSKLGKSGLKEGVESILKKADKIPAQLVRFDGWGKAMLRAGLDAGKGMKFWEDAVKRATSNSKADLEDWRRRMAGNTPNVHISGQGGGMAWTENPFQKEANAFGAGGLASAGQSLPKTADEIAAIKAAEEKKRMEEDRIADATARFRENRAKKLAAESVRNLKADTIFKKDMSFLMMPLFNPGSMWATLFASRQVFSALNTAPGGSLLGKMGGVSALAGTGILVGAATVAGMALKGLATAVQQTIKAFEQGRLLYAKALNNGMGLGFSTKRSLLAETMGVSEQDIFKFGAQLAYLNPKLEQASRILAATAPTLTATTWEWKVLQADLSATWALLASDLAPTLDVVIGGLDQLVKMFNSLADSKLFKMIIGSAFSAIFPNASTLFSMVDMLGKGGTSGMPAPQQWMKQLPASAWEHMGLQISQIGGGNNYMKDTAKNTKDAVKYLSQMAKSAIIGNGNFGMAATHNNP